MIRAHLVPALCCLALAACDHAPARTADVVSNGTRSAGKVDVVPDEEGDAGLRSGDRAPGYLDQVGAAVMATDGGFRFVDDLAASFPSDADLPSGDEAIGWTFCIDTDPDTSAVGFPMEGVRPCEFVLRVRWDGRRLQGFFIDRRPLMEGRYSQIQTMQVTWQKRSLDLLIPLEKLGYPVRFDWSASTDEFESLSSDAVHHVDELPNGGTSTPATWRSA